jgi:hypothetical protein
MLQHQLLKHPTEVNMHALLNDNPTLFGAVSLHKTPKGVLLRLTCIGIHRHIALLAKLVIALMH